MVATQMTIMYSNPVVCALLAWLLRGERLGLQGCAGIAGTLLGVVLVSEPPFLFGGHAWAHTRLVGAGLLADTRPLLVGLLAVSAKAAQACITTRTHINNNPQCR